jgi:hypothetical protein
MPRRTGCPAEACHRARQRRDPVAGHDDRRKGKHASAFPRHDLPESCGSFAPSRTEEGAGKAGCRSHPWVPSKKSSGVGPQVQPETHRLSLRNGLTAYFTLSPVTGLSCHRHLARTEFAQGLAPASGRQDHATSPYEDSAFVCRAARVHRIPPRVHDDSRSAPLAGRDGRASKGDLG